MDFAEQNPRAGTLARPYDYLIDTLKAIGIFRWLYMTALSVLIFPAPGRTGGWRPCDSG